MCICMSSVECAAYTHVELGVSGLAIRLLSYMNRRCGDHAHLDLRWRSISMIIHVHTRWRSIMRRCIDAQVRLEQVIH